MPVYDTPEEAFGELARRIQGLKKAGTLFRGLVVKTGAQQAVDMRTRAMSPQHRAHNPYGDRVDVFPTKKGVHVSVPEAVENTALAAEIGTQKQRQDPLWRPGFRRAERQADRLVQVLLEAIAGKVAAGEEMDEAFLDDLAPKVSLGPRAMDSLRDVLRDWEKEARREL